MANTLLTPSIIAREALMVLENNAVMAGLVHRDFSNEFVAHVGDTITIRKPATFVANEFKEGGTIQIQNATEEGVPVKMDKHLDVSFEVTSKDLSLKIEDFSEQFLQPAMRAFMDKIDGYLLELAAASANTVTQAGAVSPDDVVEARKFLTKNAAPLENRHMVLNSDAEADLLKSAKFTEADKVGDNGTALRTASLGERYGFDIYVDQNADATDAKGVAFHKNAFALVTRMLEQPLGAAKSAVLNYKGFGIRVVYDYDIQKKKDVISLDMLCGTKALDTKLAANIKAGA